MVFLLWISKNGRRLTLDMRPTEFEIKPSLDKRKSHETLRNAHEEKLPNRHFRTGRLRENVAFDAMTETGNTSQHRIMMQWLLTSRTELQKTTRQDAKNRLTCETATLLQTNTGTSEHRNLTPNSKK